MRKWFPPSAYSAGSRQQSAVTAYATVNKRLNRRPPVNERLRGLISSSAYATSAITTLIPPSPNGSIRDTAVNKRLNVRLNAEHQQLILTSRRAHLECA